MTERLHGPGALNHGYVPGACGDECNNLECPAGLTHDRCTPECQAAPLTMRRFIGQRLHGDASPAAYALRGIYAMHRPDDDGSCVGCHASYQEEPWTQRIDDCPELRFIAYVWAAHPDYQAEWAPQAAATTPGGIERPADDPMPVFVIKAKDQLAIRAVSAYRRLCEERNLHDQAEQVRLAAAEMSAWRERNPGAVKLPDHPHVPTRTPYDRRPARSDQ